MISVIVPVRVSVPRATFLSAVLELAKFSIESRSHMFLASPWLSRWLLDYRMKERLVEAK